MGVALDAASNLYVAEQNESLIFWVDTNGHISTVAGNGKNYYTGDGGPSTNTGIDYPQGVGFDAAGNLYIADSGYMRVRMVNQNGIIRTVAGSGFYGYSGDGVPATSAILNQPHGVALDSSGNLYIADCYDYRIRKVDTNHIITTVAGNGTAGYSGDGGAATNASLYCPTALALDAAGNLYIADYANNRIREVHFAGFPTLALTNVTAANAGSYTLVVTSPYGSVTSAVATLTVTIPPTAPQIITSDGSFGFLTNQFGFNLSGAAGQTIVVDGSTNLVDWTPLFTNTVGGNPFYFCDPAWTNFPWRFYRARLP